MMELLEEWETIKTGLTSKEITKNIGDRTINLSGALSALFSVDSERPAHLKRLVDAYNNAADKKNPEFSGIEIVGREGVGTNIKLPMALIGSFFRPVLDKIVEELETLTNKEELAELTHLLLVGGFAESDVLRHEIKRETKRLGIKLIVPKHAAQVVQKGAVEYGLDPRIISTRVARQTIGVKVTMRLKDVPDSESEEVQKHRFYDSVSKQTYVRDVFNAYIKKGQEIESSMVVRRNFRGQNDQSKKVKFDIYATDADEPKFVTDPGCVRLAKIVVEIDPETSPSLECMMQFASTEITAEIKNIESGKIQSLMLQYDNMGLQASQDPQDTFVRVPVREIGPWGDNDFDDHFQVISEFV